MEAVEKGVVEMEAVEKGVVEMEAAGKGVAEMEAAGKGVAEMEAEFVKMGNYYTRGYTRFHLQKSPQEHILDWAYSNHSNNTGYPD
jgi:hypothetical protein